MARGKRTGYQVAYCPACASEIFFRRRPGRGQLVTCRSCDSLLEVTETAPLELEWAFEEPLYKSYSRQDGDNEGDDWLVNDAEYDYFDDLDRDDRQSYRNGREY